MEAVDELVDFLDPSSSRLDLKMVALQHVLGLTGGVEGVRLLAKKARLLEHLVHLTGDKSEPIAKDSSLALINLSANGDVARVLLELPQTVRLLWERIEDKDCFVADPACMILSNLTIDKVCSDKVLHALEAAGVSLERLVFVFCQDGYNSKGAKLHYLGPVLSNLSQLAETRSQLLDRSKCVIQRLLTFTEYKASKVRRGGIVATLRNCCFDSDQHDWLLSESVDLLPRILLPLAGPTPDDLEAEDVESLPLDLQYLGDDKEMEEDPDLRKMLIEAINQLCATKSGRETVRGKGAYFILRELHKKESDPQVRLACENLVDILIKKEEEINVENYHDVVVPEDVVPELEQMDTDFLNQ